MTRVELKTLVKTHQAEIYRYLRYLGAQHAEAEDLVQDTFLTALTHRDGPTETAMTAQAAWLRGIARNLFLMHCRRQRRSRIEINSDLVEQAEGIWREEFLRDGDGFETLEALRQCVKTLAGKQHEALHQRYRLRRSRSEMAEALAMTENGVKALLRRVRLRLAECIRKRLGMEAAT